MSHQRFMIPRKILCHVPTAKTGFLVSTSGRCPSFLRATVDTQYERTTIFGEMMSGNVDKLFFCLVCLCPFVGTIFGKRPLFALGIRAIGCSLLLCPRIHKRRGSLICWKMLSRDVHSLLLLLLLVLVKRFGSRQGTKVIIVSSNLTLHPLWRARIDQCGRSSILREERCDVKIHGGVIRCIPFEILFCRIHVILLIVNLYGRSRIRQSAGGPSWRGSPPSQL
mmetsp:Transcript_40327/g.84694  ORF Transcript_40327/g.84694 Transcript_40327/m.84694 type:complete len:223 (-) Transcript_40327:1339-2007(-)